MIGIRLASLPPRTASERSRALADVASHGGFGVAPLRARLCRCAAKTMLVAATLALPRAGEASQIVVASVGAPDSAMNGATVAEPLGVGSAAFSNPASIMRLDEGAMSISLGLPVGHSRIVASQPPGYRAANDFIAIAPEAGAIFDLADGWRWGFAMYGSLGAIFDADADPSVGVTSDFLTRSGISNLAWMLAHDVGPRLSVGASLSVLFGDIHLRYTTNQHFAYSVVGGGIQGMVGARYQLTPSTGVGLGIRLPGMLWARGDERLPSGDKQDVELDLEQPTQIILGTNTDVTDWLHVGLSGRWTDTSVFGHSWFRFEDTPEGDIPFVRKASDEWRVAAGLRLDATDHLQLLAGVGFADAIVPDTWVSPLLMDSDEIKVGGGFGYTVGRWTFDFTVAADLEGDRNIDASEAVAFPGRYTMSGEVYAFGIRTTL